MQQGLLEVEFIAQQYAFFVKPVVLRCESNLGIDAVGGPGSRDGMEHRRLHAAWPAFGKRNLWRFRFGEYNDLRKRIL
jgi:hypothetical protein